MDSWFLCFVCNSHAAWHPATDDTDEYAQKLGVQSWIRVCDDCLQDTGDSADALRLASIVKLREWRIEFLLDPDAGIPDRWPGWPACRASTHAWFWRNGHLFNSAITQMGNSYPLPVGWNDLQKWAESYNQQVAEYNEYIERSNRVQAELYAEWEERTGSAMDNQRYEALMEFLDVKAVRSVADGFPDEMKIGLAVHRVTQWGEIWLFGSMQEDNAHSWQFGDAITRTMEWPGGHDRMQSLARDLRSWYRTHVSGERFRAGGRPKGSRSSEPAKEERDAYIQACQTLSPVDRTPNPIAVRMSAILDREVTPQWVDYWMDAGVFHRDPQARRRRRA